MIDNSDHNSNNSDSHSSGDEDSNHSNIDNNSNGSKSDTESDNGDSNPIVSSTFNLLDNDDPKPKPSDNYKGSVILYTSFSLKEST